MIKTNLKFGELKKLIELCGKSGVSELALGDFKIVFGGPTIASPLTPTAYQTKAAEVQSQVVEKEALMQASMDRDEEDLAVMQIENPQRFEQLMIEKEIEDDGSAAGISGHEQSVADEHLSRTKAAYGH